jgi:hypothetical protein
LHHLFWLVYDSGVMRNANGLHWLGCDKSGVPSKLCGGKRGIHSMPDQQHGGAVVHRGIWGSDFDNWDNEI